MTLPPNQKRLVLLEDDRDDEMIFCNAIRGIDPNIAIEVIRTERFFMEALERLAKNPPHLFVLDTMLRWDEIHPGFKEPPPEVKQGGHRKAGERCIRAIKAQKSLLSVSVLLYSRNERKIPFIDPHSTSITFFSKGMLDDLIAHIKQIFATERR